MLFIIILIALLIIILIALFLSLILAVLPENERVIQPVLEFNFNQPK